MERKLNVAITSLEDVTIHLEWFLLLCNIKDRLHFIIYLTVHRPVVHYSLLLYIHYDRSCFISVFPVSVSFDSPMQTMVLASGRGQ